MKIGIVVNDMENFGGAERVAANLYNALGLYHEVFYVSYFGEKIFYKVENKSNVISIIPKREKPIKYYLFEIVNGLNKIICNYGIELLIVINRYTSIPALLAKIISKVKVICCEHSSMKGYSVIDQHWFGRLHSWMLLNVGYKYIADKVVFLTKKDRDEYASLINNDDKVVNIYNWVDEKLINNEIDCDFNSKLLLSVGRIDYAKGYEYLIVVADKVFKKHKDWVWHIYGDGNQCYKNKLKKLIKDKGLEGKVVFKGLTEDIYSLYSRYSIFVLTSRYEGLPMVLLEAKSRRLPLISFDINSGPSDIICDGVDGYLVKPFDIDEMCNKICSLIENKDLRMYFSKNSYDNLQKFSRDTIVKQWCDLIDGL